MVPGSTSPLGVGTLLEQAKWEMINCPLLGDGLTKGTDTLLKRVGEYNFEWGPQPKLETASAEAQAGVP